MGSGRGLIPLAGLVRAALAAAALLLFGAIAPQPTDRCAALHRFARADLVIERAEALPAGLFVDPTQPNAAPLHIPALCRIRAVARPTPKSRITFELWLPEQDWDGRYYQLGNGGFAGYIHFPSLAVEAMRGNAVAITDTGHNADGFDARWAAGHPERVVDYGTRSIKATADAARMLTAAYYGRRPAHRYFVGCSIGGRQALMAAQRYPGDWDGIIAGSPANLWTSQLASFALIQHQLRAEPGAWLPPAKLPAIERAALATCRAGTAPGNVATDPLQCRFNPATMQCRGRETDHCLTPAQIESVRLIVRAGYEPTGAALDAGWGDWIDQPDTNANSQLTFAVQAYRYLLRDAPDWRIEDFRPARDLSAARRFAPVLDAAATDLSSFRRHGGKIIAYIGWDDPVIAPRVGFDYYGRVTRQMGGPARTRAFYRLFMVPGMLHCQGGPGPAAFGQSLPAPALRADRQHDIRMALEAWVENGIAPASLVAARYVGEDPAKGVAATRTLQPL